MGGQRFFGVQERISDGRGKGRKAAVGNDSMSCLLFTGFTFVYRKEATENYVYHCFEILLMQLNT